MKKLFSMAFILLMIPTMFFGCLKKDPIVNNNYYNINNTYNVTQSESLVVTAKNALPATVTVWVSLENNFTAGNMGSGAIIASGGYIVTNYHVISAKRSNPNLFIYILHHNTEEKHEAQLLYFNESLDIAILKDDCSQNYPVLKMEDRWIDPVLNANNEPNKLNALEDVLAIGTPISLKLRGTVTLGTVNSELYRYADSDTNRYERLIQFDAAISSGNSGGPVIDRFGNVIGLATLQVKDNNEDYGDANSLFFAVPIKPVILVIDKIISAYEAGNLTDSYYTAPKLNAEVTDKYIVNNSSVFNQDGVKVVAVNNPGASFGKLVANDVIIKAIIEGQTYDINMRDDLTYALLRCTAGQTISLVIKDKPNVVITLAA